jgi:hypothetical protein
MTLEHGAVEAEVKIREPRHAWMWQFVIGVSWLAVAAGNVWRDRPVVALFWLTLGCVMAAAALWSRTLGVDLTRESANLRGPRWRSVPWHEVQAVVRYGRRGAWGVRLVLEHGKPVTLRAPTTVLGLGAAQFDRDFHRIDQWWLAHRGESWRPAHPEPPRPPAQG